MTSLFLPAFYPRAQPRAIDEDGQGDMPSLNKASIIQLSSNNWSHHQKGTTTLHHCRVWDARFMRQIPEGMVPRGTMFCRNHVSGE